MVEGELTIFHLACGHFQRSGQPQIARTGKMTVFCKRCVTYRGVSKVIPRPQTVRESMGVTSQEFRRGVSTPPVRRV